MNKCLVTSTAEWRDFLAGLVHRVGHADENFRSTDTIQELHEVLRVDPNRLSQGEKERFVQLSPNTVASTELLAKAAAVVPEEYPCVVLSEFYHVGGECFLSATIQFVYESDFNVQ